MRPGSRRGSIPAPSLGDCAAAVPGSQLTGAGSASYRAFHMSLPVVPACRGKILSFLLHDVLLRSYRSPEILEPFRFILFISFYIFSP